MTWDESHSSLVGLERIGPVKVTVQTCSSTSIPLREVHHFPRIKLHKRFHLPPTTLMSSRICLFFTANARWQCLGRKPESATAWVGYLETNTEVGIPWSAIDPEHVGVIAGHMARCRQRMDFIPLRTLQPAMVEKRLSLVSN